MIEFRVIYEKMVKNKSTNVSSKIRFNVRSAFNKDILPFIKDVEPYFKEINDSIPIIPYLEKSKGFQQRNFGKPPSLTYRVVDAIKNIVELTYPGETVLAYQKVIHLLDAYKHLRYGDVYSEANMLKLWTQGDLSFMNEPQNQAYVDVASSFLASSIHEQLKSPHFARFYQTFRSLPDTYKLHITDDISSYRFSNWFWQAFDKGTFTLEVRERASNAILTQDEILQLLRPDPDMCCDSSSDEESSTDSSINAEILDNLHESENKSIEVESVEDFECENSQPDIIHRDSSHTRNKEQDSESSEFDAYVIHAILKSMPVIVMHTELMSGNMDELLEQEEFEDGWSDKWTAWLFQVICALQQLQTHFNLVHNDLHTNNILWKNTDLTHYFYKSKTGKIYKVPTYGKRFTVIDFGRATLVFNSVDIASSDFRDGADADGQYNYGVWRNKDEPIMRPNPSFDLCRLSCSVIRVLFPVNPDYKHEDAAIISVDGRHIVKETNNELFNMLWSWLVDDRKHNVLENADGEERFLGFDLYQHIAEYCHNALPSVWLEKPIFRKYIVEKSNEDCIAI
jgi:hypothetical protein